jgi:formylglycine-generating enzyme required for sulfatase activity
MEESNDSCCAPQRPESPSGAMRQEFSTAALLSSTNFVTIPAGEFVMGTDDPFYPTDGEGPSRSIWVDEFKISKFSVSNSEFVEFIGVKTPFFLSHAKRSKIPLMLVG